MKFQYHEFNSILKNEICTFNHFVYADPFVWFYSNINNSLFKYDIKNNKRCELIHLPYKFFDLNHMEDLMDIVGKYKNYIVGVNRIIRIVELTDTRNNKSYQFNLCGMEDISTHIIPGVIIVDSWLFIYVPNKSYIYCCNIENYFNNLVTSSIDIVLNKYDIDIPDTIEYAKYTGGKIFLYGEKCEYLYSVKLDTNTACLEPYKKVGIGLKDIVVERDNIYMLLENKICIYEIKTNDLMGCFFLPSMHNDKRYAKIVIVKNNIWIFPATEDNIYYIDIINKKISEFNDYPREYCYLFPSDHEKFCGIIDNGNICYIGQRSANYSFILDKNTGELNFKQILYPEKFYDEIWSVWAGQKIDRLCVEWQYQLSDFIRNI